jgi:hypothetical protein
MDRHAFHAVSLVALVYSGFLLLTCVAIVGEYYWTVQYRGGAPVLMAVIEGSKFLIYVVGAVGALLSIGNGLLARRPMTWLQYAVMVVVAAAFVMSLADVAFLLTHLQQLSAYVTAADRVKGAALALATVNSTFAIAYLGGFGVRGVLTRFAG